MTPPEANHTPHPRPGLLIGGEWIFDRPAYSEVRNPSTGEVLTAVPGANAGDIAAALRAAEAGFRRWRDTPPVERVAILRRAMELLQQRSEDIARTITLENGKLLLESRIEIERSVTYFEWGMAESLRAYGHVVPGPPQMHKWVLRQPIGPVAAFTPWNMPLGSPARKLGAALAAGCPVILKAAEETPGAAVALARCLMEAGLPAGVLNLLFGDPDAISHTLIASPVTRLVTLTGSVGVGKHLSQLAAAAMKPVLMELGGHAPVLVCAGVDPVRVGRMAAQAKVRVNGQICASPSRYLVHESVYAGFVSAFVQTLNKVRTGDGLAPNVDMGPLANARRLAAMQALVDDARQRGATVAAGGQRIGTHGYFFQPTLLTDLPPDAAVMTTEPFGPVAGCVPFKTLDEALAIANGLSLGLAAYAFTNSLTDAERITRELECGVLSINHFGTPECDTPFGGVKDSGIGREGGIGALDAYLVSKTLLQSTQPV